MVGVARFRGVTVRFLPGVWRCWETNINRQSAETAPYAAVFIRQRQLLGVHESEHAMIYCENTHRQLRDSAVIMDERECS